MASRTTSVFSTIRWACWRPASMMSSASRRALARNSSRSFSSQRAWRISSGSAATASSSSATSSSRLTITLADIGTDRAVSMWSRTWRMSSSVSSVSRGTGRRVAQPAPACGAAGPRSTAAVVRSRILESWASRRITEGGTMLDTSPPNLATSFTRLDDRNECCGTRRDEERVDAREALVHLRHLELVVEVGDGPEALHDRGRVVVAREVDEQALEELDRDVAEVRGLLVEHVLALLEGEQRLRLLRVADDRDDDVVEVPRGPLDDVEMTEGDRVEGTRAECGGHGAAHSSSTGRRSVDRVAHERHLRRRQAVRSPASGPVSTTSVSP